VVSKSKGNQVQMAGYYDPEAVKRLRTLSEVTRVPQAAYLREALEDLLRKYASVLRKAK
jgi:predicted DNA-binding protein